MRISRIINLRNPELLSLPWSEQRAKEERTRSEEMPPKPVPGDPSGCRQLSENPGSCHKTKGLHNKNTHSPAVTKMFSIYFAAIQHLLFKLQVPNISSFLFEYVFHRTSDPHLRSFQIENVGNGCGYIELHHALLKFRNPFDVLPGNNKRRFKLLKRLPAVTFPDAP